MSKKIFLFVGIETEDNSLFELTDNGLIEVEDSNKIESRGAICLIYEPPISNLKSKSNFINVSINDITLTDQEIIRESHIKFGKAAETKIFPLPTNKGYFKLSLSVDKDILKKLFIEYEFSKIMPLSIFLWMNKKGVNGIISENINFFKIVNENFMEISNILDFQKLVYSEEYSENVDVDNLSVLSNIYKTNTNEDTKMNLYSMEETYEEELFDDFYPDVIGFKDFQKEILSSKYFIQDTVSAYYKSKFLKPFFVISIVFFIGVNVLLFMLNGKFVVEKSIVNGDIEENQLVLNKIMKKNKFYKKDNYWEYLSKPYIKEDIEILNNKLKEIINFPFIKDLKISVVSPGRVNIDFKIEEFKEYLKLEKYYKSKHILFKINKKNEIYNFKFILNLNKEAEKLKSKNKRRR